MNVEITKLPNGLTIVTDPMPQLESAALGVWVNCGARNETRNVMGVSHMLEHMAFKGTRTPGGASGDRPGARYARRHHLRSSADDDLPEPADGLADPWRRRHGRGV